MKNKPRYAGRIAAVAAVWLGLAIAPARAQFTNHDGVNQDGSYRVQVELTPYAWVPAVSASANFGLRHDQSGNINTGIPSVSKLVDTLTGVFMGYGFVHYGPYFMDVDIQAIGVGQHRDFPVGPRGNSVRLNASVDITRVAPGIGYTVYSGEVGGIPASLDVRAGAAWFDWSSKISASRDFGGVSRSDNFVQPWAGLRGFLVFTPAWRLEVSAMAQGFGVDGGSWGWGASAILSYALADWAALSGGFRALSSSRQRDGRFDDGALDVTAYGPVIGVTFRF